jgi:hypothetical protein
VIPGDRVLHGADTGFDLFDGGLQPLLQRARIAAADMDAPLRKKLTYNDAVNSSKAAHR